MAEHIETGLPLNAKLMLKNLCDDKYAGAYVEVNVLVKQLESFEELKTIKS